MEALTQKELATLRADEPLEPGEAYKITEEPPGPITRFFSMAPACHEPLTKGFAFGTRTKGYMAKGQRSMKKNKYNGSSFDDFLQEEGIYEEVKTLAQKELAAARYKHYPIVIYKDSDSDYSLLVPDLPGCCTAGDTIADVQQQAVETIELHLEGILRDGDPIPEPKDITFHENNPEYADGQWESIAVIIPDISNIQVAQSGPIRRFFQRFSQAIQTLRQAHWKG